MPNQFYMKPVAFAAPADLTNTLRYIVGVSNKGWIDYTPEVYAELLKEWEAWQASGAKVQLLVDEEPEVFEVVSNSDPSKKYTVRKQRDGSWTCDCAGFSFRKKCSHIEKTKNKK